MALADRITINAAGLSQDQLDALKKGVAPHVGLTSEQTWEDVTTAMISAKFAEVIKAWAINALQQEAKDAVSPVDMDA